MAQIPSNAVASIALAQLTQSQRASEQDAPREAAARKAEHRSRLQAENREFIEDLVETAGLKVDADDSNQSEKRKKKRQQAQAEQSQIAKDAPAHPADDSRARSAALLATPDDSGKSTPPPFMLDIEA